MTISSRVLRCARHLSTYGVWVTVCMGLALSSCRHKKAEVSTVETATIAPGAQGWEALTMQLPAGSPAVVRVQPEETLTALRDAFAWLTADAAMFGAGEEGEERVRMIRALHSELSTSFGADPLDLKTWSTHGVALDAPAYIGVHPLSAQGTQFVKEIEQELAVRLDMPDTPLAEALKIRIDTVDHTGLYAAVNTAGRHSDAALGVRMVLGLSDEARALDRIDNLFSDELYARVARVATPSIRRVYFTDRNEQALTFVARVEEEGRVLVLDAFYIPMIKAKERDARQLEVMTHVDSVLARTPAGRALAPTPSQESALSLGMSQQGISKILRYLSYREAIVNASGAAAAERDEQVYITLGLSVLQMSYWDTGARGIQGINYEFDAGGTFEGTRRMFGFEMQLFGERGLTPPPVRAAARNLGVNESGVGMSLDPAMLFSSEWRDWLAPEKGVRLLEVLGDQFDDETQSDLGSFFFIVALPRLFAQLMTVVEDELKEEIPIEIVPVYAQRAHVLRVEAVLPGLDLSNMWRDPNVVMLLTLDPALSTLDRDAFSAALRDTLYYSFDFTSEPTPTAADAPQESYTRARALKPGEVQQFQAPSSNALSQMYYYYERDADAPYIVLSKGSLARAHLDKLLSSPPGKSSATQGSFRLKLDPTMLLQLANSYEEAEWDLINLPILTQRMGPMLFNITPGTRQGDGLVTYRFDLMAPTSLDSGL